MSRLDTDGWAETAERDHAALVACDDAWADYVERETEAGRCPYCTWGLRYDRALGYRKSCPECDGTGLYPL